jgi:oligopeptide transport system ATP-binding protein
MSEPILSVQDLSVTFDVHKQGAWPWTPAMKLHAVSQMSFDLQAGECLGVVGESGSGKSTLARAIVGTVPSSGGRINFEGADLAGKSGRNAQG